MDLKFVNVGFSNIVSAQRIIAVVSADSAPVRRAITEARSRNLLIDATNGRRTRAVIMADSGHIILSAVQPETVLQRIDSA